MYVGKNMISVVNKPMKGLFGFLSVLFSISLVLFSLAVSADEIDIVYLDDAAEVQSLKVTVASSAADYEMAAGLILKGSKFTVSFDDKEDLELIIAAINEYAPDNATAVAINNTILGVSTLLGGQSQGASPQAPATNAAQVDTPPVSAEVNDGSGVPIPAPPVVQPVNFTDLPPPSGTPIASPN